MRFAKIENGQLKTARLIHDSTGTHDANADTPTTPNGWQLVEGEVTADEIDSDEFPVLTRRQIRLALLGLGVTSEAVEQVIAQLPEGVERESAMIYWQDTNSFHRNHPLLVQVASALSLFAEQLDPAWMSAASLDA